MMKKVSLIILSVIMCLTPLSGVFAEADTRIFSDPVQNVYSGRVNGKDYITSVNFTDVSASHWAREAVIRMASLDVVKGYAARSFRPNNRVTNAEALAFCLRLMGLEKAAQERGVALANRGTEAVDSSQQWALGYIDIAADRGLITRDQRLEAQDSLQSEEGMDGFFDEEAFLHNSPATRQDVAEWVCKAIEYLSPGLIDLNKPAVKIYEFRDPQDIELSKIPYMEALASLGIISGSNGRLNPKQPITRAEMVQILRNLDTIYFQAAGLVGQSGTVAAIKDSQTNQTNNKYLTRSVYIRTKEGTVDVIQFEVEQSNNFVTVNRDSVFNDGGQVKSLSSLSQGQSIFYITRGEEVLYVEKTGEMAKTTVAGYLEELNQTDNTIVIRDRTGKVFTYYLVQGILSNGRVTVDGVSKPVQNLPIGSQVSLTLMNETVLAISYVGEPTLKTEIRGVVVDNDPDLGYITVVNHKGVQVSKQYNPDVVVEKTEYYMNDDTIGYIDTMFPDFRYDPRDTNPENLEAGDIVYMNVSPSDSNYVTEISAVTNYAVDYGKITQINHMTNPKEVLIEYEDKRTAWFLVPLGTFVSEQGKPSSVENMEPGDWVKMLVNRATLEPGYIVETVKEIVIEGDEHFISSIHKGQLSGMDMVQGEIILKNAQTLSRAGWINYNQLKKFNGINSDIEIYNNDQRISMDFAMRYLKHSDGEVYVAMENHYAGERVKRITFRSARDEVLSPSFVLASDSSGNFKIAGEMMDISADDGTIIRRNGRLVTKASILPTDYASVVLNGAGKAAIVDIYSQPDITGVIITRGRISYVEDNQFFEVSSMSLLTGNDWAFTPINRTFETDYNTRFYDEDGYVSMDTFRGYGENNQVDEVYTIIANGTKATHVFKNPFAQKVATGIVYENDGETFSLRDVTAYNEKTGKYSTFGGSRGVISVTVPENGFIVKNNKVVGISEIKQGDKVRVLSTVIGAETTAYIVFVES